MAEILYGMERHPSGRRKDTLWEAAVDVFSRFTEDVLPFDAAATVYPEIVDQRDRLGTSIGGYDAQIAAICRANDASLATSNEKEFGGVGVQLINLWLAG